MNLPLAAGLQQRTDDRARPQPYLDICRDVQFDEIGGIQTRLPYLAMNNTIFGGGTLSNCRRLAVVNGELCVFTDTQFYSWNAQLATWVLRGTHMAAMIDTAQRFARATDQFFTDRAELNGTVVYAWFEPDGSLLGGAVYAAAMDKVTESVLVTSTLVTPSSGSSFSVRLVALATKILMLTEVGGANRTLEVRAIDPAAPLTGIQSVATTILASGVSGGTGYDVVRVLGADQAVGAAIRATTTSYSVFTVTAGLVVAASTKARTADGRIAVASRPSAGAQTHIFRTVSGTTQVLGDVVTTSTLADVATGQVIGTYTANPNHLTACYRSAQTAGHFVCRAFWTANEFSANTPETKSNTVDDAGTIGTQATFANGLGIASRAFDYSGSVYVNTMFALNSLASTAVGASLQNTYFLYREDGSLIGKALAGVASGYENVGVRPGVDLTGPAIYSWAGARRRTLEATSGTALPEAGGNSYGSRTLTDITITFDTNAARRTAQIGRTGYITGAEVLQYDGVRLVECGFNTFAYSFAPADAGVTGGGAAMAAGTYAYKPTFSYTNAQGEKERSTTAAIATVAIAAGASSMSAASADSGPLFTTRKTSPAPAFEVWRTVVDPPPGDPPFYRVSSQDPSATTNPNRYLLSSSPVPAFTDELADTAILSREQNPEGGDVLEVLAPPPATIIIATEARLFLAGVAGDPDRVWPSRERGDGEIASFHDSLPIDIPGPGGDITAIWFQDEILYVARETALYALPGRGRDNQGQGSGYGPARIVSADIGAISQESVVLTPHGTLFQSRKGWQLLDRSGSAVLYVGGAVFDFETETVLATSIAETQHHVRILTNQRVILWAYPREGAAGGSYPQQMAAGGQWGEWTNGDGVHACMWQGSHVILTATGPKIQQTSYSALTYGLDVEETWIKLADLQGAARVRKIQPLGEYRSAFLLRMRVAYNYDPTYVDDVVWTPTPAVVGGALQMAHGPKRPACQAIKVRITAVTDAVRARLLTASMSPTVPTSGAAWTSTWTAASALPGEAGNALTMTVSAIAFTAVEAPGLPLEMPFDLISETGAVIVNDNATWSPASSSWVAAPNNIGVLVAGSLTVSDLEAVIAATTTLATLTAPDASPTKTVDTATLLALAQVSTGAFAGGVYGAPTGEALKLTGLALDVGIEGGLYRRLAREQAV
jgi:hypothetical protein